MDVALRPLATVLLAALLGAFLAGCGAAEDLIFNEIPDDDGSDQSSMSAAEEAWGADVLMRTNQERAKVGVGPVTWHWPAAEVAYQHCGDMDVRDFFDHVNPDGLDPAERLTAGGVAWLEVGENISRGRLYPEDAVDAWMDSPPHRATLLDPKFTHLGVGVRIRDGGPWWTQLFLTPP
jgi:uncharacterized protein YkwD